MFEGTAGQQRHDSVGVVVRVPISVIWFHSVHAAVEWSADFKTRFVGASSCGAGNSLRQDRNPTGRTSADPTIAFFCRSYKHACVSWDIPRCLMEGHHVKRQVILFLQTREDTKLLTFKVLIETSTNVCMYVFRCYSKEAQKIANHFDGDYLAGLGRFMLRMFCDFSPLRNSHVMVRPHFRKYQSMTPSLMGRKFSPS